MITIMKNETNYTVWMTAALIHHRIVHNDRKSYELVSKIITILN